MTLNDFDKSAIFFNLRANHAQLEKRLYDFFTEKLTENLREAETIQDAFAKTNDEIGFTAYKSFHSYNTIRKSKRRKTRR